MFAVLDSANLVQNSGKSDTIGTLRSTTANLDDGVLQTK